MFSWEQKSIYVHFRLSKQNASADSPRGRNSFLSHFAQNLRHRKLNIILNVRRKENIVMRCVQLHFQTTDFGPQFFNHSLSLLF